MPIKANAIKALRQSKKRTVQNARMRRTIDIVEKKARRGITQGASTVQETVRSLQQLLDKAVQRDVLKRNTAGRKIAQLMRAMTKKK